MVTVDELQALSWRSIGDGPLPSARSLSMRAYARPRHARYIPAQLGRYTRRITTRSCRTTWPLHCARCDEKAPVRVRAAYALCRNQEPASHRIGIQRPRPQMRRGATKLEAPHSYAMGKPTACYTLRITRAKRALATARNATTGVKTPCSLLYAPYSRLCHFRPSQAPVARRACLPCSS